MKNSILINTVILLSLISIAANVFIYTNAANSVVTATEQLSIQEVEVYNASWESYKGNNTGSNIKALINRILSSEQVYKEDSTHHIDFECEPTEEYIGNPIEIKHTSEIDQLTDEYSEVRNKLENKHTYYVDLHYSIETSMVDSIYVYYNNPNLTT